MITIVFCPVIITLVIRLNNLIVVLMVTECYQIKSDISMSQNGHFRGVLTHITMPLYQSEHFIMIHCLPSLIFHFRTLGTSTIVTMDGLVASNGVTRKEIFKTP